MMEKSDLLPRIITGVLLVAVALSDVWLGGLFFAVMVLIGAALMVREWVGLLPAPSRLRLFMQAILAISLAIVAVAPSRETFIAVMIGILAASLFLALVHGVKQASYAAAAMGLAYAGLPAAALIWMREQPQGMYFVLWTLAVVWATDICAYFAGRTLGGPKIAPAISPSKTWSGLSGGMAGAGLASGLLSVQFGWADGDRIWLYVAGGLVAAILAQTGDFFESWLKRRVGVKDSGKLFPGHGGILDRLDGLVPVAVAAAMILAFR